MSETTTATNWLDSDNPFSLAKPPDWWLKRLYDFDYMLVMFPSHKMRQYVLARRRSLTAGLGDVAMLDNKHPDTSFCYRHALLPINMPLRPTGPNPWTEDSIADVIAALKRRDIWAHTGGEQTEAKVKLVTDVVEGAQDAVERKLNRGIWDDFYYKGRDAYRSLKARVGSRNKRASDYHGVARPKPMSGGSTTS